MPSSQQASPLMTLNEVAALAQRAPLSYRRTILPSPQHPRPVNNRRPALYRRSDVLKFLGVEVASHV